MSLIAPINKIIPFSTVDGPGNRTSVFFQKCNIHCLYCHNPETQNLCFNCGECVKTCPSHALTLVDGKVVYNSKKCINCDTCISVCKLHASPKVINMSVEEVYKEILKNVPFIRGITVSGGECSLYLPFLKELFKLCKNDGLTCLMDSNGMIPYPRDDFFTYCDGVMLDIKSWNNETYKKLVGFDNDIVKSNLKYLNEIDKITELRIVYVPSYVDAKSCLDGIKEIIKDKVRTTHIKLITFRNLGVKSILSSYPSPTKEEMKELYNYAISLGYNNLEIR